VPRGDILPNSDWYFKGQRQRKPEKAKAFILFILLLLTLLIYGKYLKHSFLNKESRAANLDQFAKANKTSTPKSASPIPNHIGKIPISFHTAEQNKYIKINEKKKITYTINVALQEYIQSILKKYRVRYGVVVALEPDTGNILALAGYSKYYKSQSKNMKLCFRASFPAASIIKLVTAAAALELDSLTPQSQISYEGNMYHISPQKLRRTRKRYRSTTSFASALAKSNNVVFAKIAMDNVGARNLLDYAQRFGFNRNIVNYLSLEMSTAQIPDEPYKLGKTGAGLGEIYMSPLHGAIIAATIANKGEMMTPHLIEEIRDPQGKTLYQVEKKSLGKVIQPDTASQLDQMMQETVRLGTARKTFKDRRGRPFFPDMEISGKTGSLNGNNPPGCYHWFVGFAPSDKPKIAIAALVINRIDGAGWRIKGTQLARMVLQKYFSK
jgi:cell division protein FtsI/penicillin-binding protein 2